MEAWLKRMKKPLKSKKDTIYDSKRYREISSLVLKRKSSFLVPRDHTGVPRTQTTTLPTG